MGLGAGNPELGLEVRGPCARSGGKRPHSGVQFSHSRANAAHCLWNLMPGPTQCTGSRASTQSQIHYARFNPAYDSRTSVQGPATVQPTVPAQSGMLLERETPHGSGHLTVVQGDRAVGATAINTGVALPLLPPNVHTHREPFPHI